MSPPIKLVSYGARENGGLVQLGPKGLIYRSGN